jgi:uncharacterized repeat protein (TIGR01451 family)
MNLFLHPSSVRRFVPRPVLLGAILLLSGAFGVAHAADDPAQSPDGVWRLSKSAGRGSAALSTAAASSGPQLYSLDRAALQAQLAKAPMEPASPGAASSRAAAVVLSLPTPDGTFAAFRIHEIVMMEPALAAKFPEIRTYRGQGVDDRTATAVISVTTLGFHAQVRSAVAGVWLVDPSAGATSDLYISHRQDGDSAHANERFICSHTPAAAASKPTASASARRNSEGESIPERSGDARRTYRLACAATGEYTAAVGGGTVAGGLAAIAVAINRVNGIFEQELSIRFVLVGNNDQLVFTNAATDGYSNDDGDAMLGENQAKVDAVIGSGNYDIGHVFSTGGGGVAINGVCQADSKAQGVTGLDNPVGDAFYVSYVAHEIGHQFGANHTFNTDSNGGCAGNRYADAAYEPGSGSTIMGYAGLCSPDDVQGSSNPYFHFYSYEEMRNYITPGIGLGDCPAPVSTGNSAPVVDAGRDYTIPKGTPFVLTGVASDAEEEHLSYTWEERDLGPAQGLGAPDNGSSPLFRSWPPSLSPARYFPDLADLVNNVQSKAEQLPTQSRAMRFRLTVRDHHVGSGGVDFDDMTVFVAAEAGPFRVTSQPSPITWPMGSGQTITWSVAGTDGNGINARHVNILFSQDGGYTFPTVLAANTPNDGTEVIAVPAIATSLGRIKVEGAGNIFFDISDADITIAAPPRVTIDTPTSNSTVMKITSIAGTISEPDGEAIEGNIVRVTLRDIGADQYWNGSDWVTSAADFTAPVGTDSRWSTTSLPTGTKVRAGVFAISATARDAAGNVSTPEDGVSRIAVTVVPDTVGPAVAIATPQHNSFIPAFATLAGTATDNDGSGIAANLVNLRLLHVESGEYWNGSGWGAATSIAITVHESGSWAYSGALPSVATDNLRQGEHVITADARDNEGNPSEPQTGVNNVSFIVDSVPPEVSIAPPVGGTTLTSSTVPQNWIAGSATDNRSEPTTTVRFRRLSDNRYWNGKRWESQPADLALTVSGASWSLSSRMPQPGAKLEYCMPNGAYEFVATATDRAGNTAQSIVNITVDYHPNFPVTELNPPQNDPPVPLDSVEVTEAGRLQPRTGSSDSRDVQPEFLRTDAAGTFHVGTNLTTTYDYNVYAITYPFAVIQKAGAWRLEREQSSSTDNSDPDNPVTRYYERWSSSTSAFGIDQQDHGNWLQLAGMEVDGQGNTYAAFNVYTLQGAYASHLGQSIYYQRPTLTTRILLMKFDPAGNILSRTYHGPSANAGSIPGYYPHTQIRSMKVSPDGAVTLLANNYYSYSNPGGPSSYGSQSLLLRIAPDGTEGFTRPFGFGDVDFESTYRSAPELMTLDSQGNALIATLESLDTQSEQNIHVLRKVSPSGDILARTELNVCQDEGSWEAIAADPAGNVYIGSNYQFSDEDVRLSVLKFDPNLIQLWRGLAPTGTGGGVRLLNVRADGVTIGGTGVDAYTASATRRWSFARFTLEGEMLWARRDTKGFVDQAVCDSAGNVLVFGSIDGSGGSVVPGYGKISNAGDVQFAKPLPAGNGFGQGNALTLATDEAARLYIDPNTREAVVWQFDNPANIVEPAPVMDTTEPYKSGYVGQSFSYQFRATHNPTSYTLAGTLPTGLSFDSTTGEITGTPEAQTASGGVVVSATATNRTGTSAPFNLTIEIFGDASSPVADVSVASVTHSPDVAAIDGELVYTITLRNAGPDTAPNVTAILQLDSHTSFVESSAFAAYDGGSNLFYVYPRENNDMAAGEDRTFTFTVRVNADTPDGSTLGLDVVAQTGSNDPDGFNNNLRHTVPVGGTPGDVDGPALTSLTLSPDAVDVTAEPRTMTATLRVTDATGFGYSSITFTSPSGNSQFTADIFESDRIAGTATDGTYSVTVTAPRYIEPGTYSVLVQLSDTLDNYAFYGAGGRNPIPTGSTQSLTVQNTSGVDQQPAALVSLDVSPSSVDVTTAAQAVTVTLGVTDDLAGFDFGSVTFTSPDGSDSVSVGFIGDYHRVSGTATNGLYKVTAQIRGFVQPGTWSAAVTLIDRASRFSFYGGTNPLPPGSTGQLTVVNNGGVDRAAPEMTALQINPAAVDVTSAAQQLNVSFHVDDDVSGLHYGYFELVSPTGVHYVAKQFNFEQRTSGTATSGDYAFAMTMPRYVEPGEWKASLTIHDLAGSRTSYGGYNQAPLHTVAVTNSGAVDGTAPVLAGLSVSPSQVNVANSPQQITVTMTVEDAPAGFLQGEVGFYGPSAGPYADGATHFAAAERIGGDETRGTYRAVFTIPKNAEVGTWQMGLALADGTGRSRFYGHGYYGSEPLPPGMNGAISVTQISNAVPVVNAGADLSVTVGQNVVFSGAFTDADPGDSHMLAWDFGDGGSASGTLSPVHVYAAAGTYTATLSVSDSKGSTGSDTVTVTVSPPPPTYGEWSSAAFSPGTPPEARTDTADPDRDGLPNLLEYAFNMSPENGSRTGLPTIGRSAATATTADVAMAVSAASGSTYLTLTYTRRIGSTDLGYIIAVSTNLTTWDKTHAMIEQVGAPVPVGDGQSERVTVRYKNPVSTTPKVFLRVDVQKQ